MTEPRLADKRIVVTGAAGGIGRAVVGSCVANGAEVLGVDLREPDSGEGSPADHFLAADLESVEGNRDAIGMAGEMMGGIDAIVACAGFQWVAPLPEFPEAIWARMLNLMLTSPFLLAKYAWKELAEAGDGRFIVMSSVHGLLASPFKTGYVSAKHGVMGLVKSLAVEGAEHGISSVAVCPAYVHTGLVEDQIEAQATAHGISREEVIGEILLKRQARKEMLDPQDVAESVVHVLGPGGAALTGSALNLGQGWTSW